ncbi:MAG: M1 family aminopeptidase [Candidatus Aminicenantes bacterium]|nr:M1 family aminopeptidase [Candidatus Aminicenantes bacterium]
MRQFGPLVFVLGLGLGLATAAAPPPEQSLDEFLCQLIKSFQAIDLPGYLANFEPDARSAEETEIASYFKDLGMDAVRLRQAGRLDAAGPAPRVFLQAFFENATAAIIETWQFDLVRTEGGWRVRKKTVGTNKTNLFKLRLPADRIERAARVEISHVDIKITFRNAAVFYDNLPGLETAVLVTGRGRLHYSPSDPVERHLLDLVYKKEVLEDDLEYVYVRSSNAYFSRFVRLEPAGAGAEPVTAKETTNAATVFARNYSRSFTIETPFAPDLMSFLPQGEEAVFEFKGRRVGEMTYIYYPFAEEEVNLYDRDQGRIVNLYSPREKGEAPNLRRMYISLGEKFDVQDYQLEADVNPPAFHLSAKARIRILSQADSLDGIKFRFAPELQILKIIDAEGRELFYTQDKLRKILYIYFLEPPGRNEEATVEVYYRGRLVPPMPAIDVVQAGSQDRFVFQPRYENCLYTQTALWYPAPSDEDYFTARMKILVPSEYKVVAGGEVVERGRWTSTQDAVAIDKLGNPYWTFEMRQPVKYLAFLAGKLDRLNETSSQPPVEVFASADVLMQRQDFSASAREILDFYAGLFGPFPYEKLTVVQRLWPTAGGVSPPGFVVLNEPAWIVDRPYVHALNNPVYLANWVEYFLAHEIAHQWWGQAVTWGSYRDQWLSEGMAQFATVLFLRFKYGERAFLSILKKLSQWTEKKGNIGPVVLGSRLSYFDFDAYQAIVYNKTTLVMLMLKDLMGEEAFFTGLREFFSAQRYRPTRTGQFIQAMEKSAGRELRSFFDGWFFAYELPDVVSSTEEERVGDGFQLRLRLSQKNGPFVFPLTVEWTVDGQRGREKLVVDEPVEEIILPTGLRGAKVRLNPDRAVPGRFR